MSERILMVDDVPEVLDAFARMLGPKYRVTQARSAEEALDRCRCDGPFAVVVADYEMPGMKGTELLMRVREEWPETVAVLLTGVVQLDVAVDALHNGRIFRFLEKPCPIEHLRLALEDALEEHGKCRAARTLSSELSFSREALAHFNGSLDRLIGEQADALLRLNRFVSDLNSVDSLHEVAELAASAAHDLLGARAVSVELAGFAHGEIECCTRLGREHAAECHTEAIRTSEGVLGRIAVDQLGPDGRQLAYLHRSLLASIASSTAVAAHNQVRRRERDQAQHATILALAKLAEQRDNETGKHLERVSLYSTLIAEGLREDGWYRDVITDEFVRDLYRSAPLHDIGKVGIPDSILLKPGKLTSAEWEVMKTHTVIGAQTLQAVIAQNKNQSFLRMSLDIAWSHHEFWDGTGYPRGLIGEEIPLSARILAMADVYDALTTLRVYKPAWPHERALERILGESGTHFDPRLAAAFKKRERAVDQIRARLADTRDEILAQLRLRGAPELSGELL